MVIEFKPQKRSKMPLLFTLTGVVAVFLILAFLGSYIYFYITNKNLVQKIQQIKDSVVELDKTIEDKESQLLITSQRIEDFGLLIANHKNIASAFDFINKNSIPVAWFNSFEKEESKDNTKDAENSVIIKGKANSFFLIEQQITTFKKQNLVKDVRLKEIGINEKEGTIDYAIVLTFDPEIFVYK